MRVLSRGLELPAPPYPKHTRNVNLVIFDLRRRLWVLARKWDAEKKGREYQQ